MATVFAVGFASSYGSDDVSNQPPTLDDIPPQIVDELSTLTFTATATDPDLPAQALAVDDASSGDIAYSAAVVDGVLRFNATIAETDGQQFPYDHRLLFYIVVADGHDPPGTDTVAIRVYLSAAGEPDWPAC